MGKEVCLVVINKRSNGSFKKVTEIYRYDTLNVPKKDEIVILPWGNEMFVVKKIYHFALHNIITCVGYVLEDDDEKILSKSIKMLDDVIKSDYR